MKAKKATAPKKSPAKPKAAKVTKASAPKVKAPKVKTLPDLKDFISAELDAAKAKNIVTIDLKGKTPIADFMLIATGTSSRHVASLARNLKDELSTKYKIRALVEGQETGDWVIVDAGDIIVHLFREEVREFYNLEKLWGSDFSTVMYTRYQSV